MDAPVIKSTNQLQWIELLGKVQELAEATSTENTELSARVKELELELLVWKQAHSAAREAAERENKIRDEQLAVLRKQVSGGGHGLVVEKDGLVLCVIDGTKTFFAAPYLKQGEHGGRRAGQEISNGIHRHLTEDNAYASSDISLWIFVYVNKRRLVTELVGNAVCTALQLDAFCAGLSETSPSLNIIDVASKKDADSKIREYLQMFSKLQHNLRIYTTGGYGSEYSPSLPYLDVVAPTASVVLVRGHSYPSFGSFGQGYPHILLEGLFMKDMPSDFSTAPTSFSGITPVSAGVDEERSQMGSPDLVTFTPATRTVPVLDPTLPLYKQNPPPCNEHYLLAECSKNGRCKYSHEYELNEEQLATLAKNAKQSPCWFLNNDMQCPYGDGCCWGHVCPFGIKCHFSSKDKCRFKGAGMHRPRGDTSNY
ncbi:hypothetical protein BV25DRAFT_1910657 [Artomyces pyxidatus]|uniref:Uncharacterized protein n=1 Tax=Artomyces pyxidatus TaxID=48021 RepID=A0ACB8TKJ6_9AGAM|nr:hypothetical protein BV25DRAFT_1910657 [Artomyces pyxidatus]